MFQQFFFFFLGGVKFLLALICETGYFSPTPVNFLNGNEHLAGEIHSSERELPGLVVLELVEALKPHGSSIIVYYFGCFIMNDIVKENAR